MFSIIVIGSRDSQLYQSLNGFIILFLSFLISLRIFLTGLSILPQNTDYIRPQPCDRDAIKYQAVSYTIAWQSLHKCSGLNIPIQRKCFLNLASEIRRSRCSNQLNSQDINSKTQYSTQNLPRCAGKATSRILYISEKRIRVVLAHPAWIFYLIY